MCVVQLQEDFDCGLNNVGLFLISTYENTTFHVHVREFCSYATLVQGDQNVPVQ
jgi:hypothetical protein